MRSSNILAYFAHLRTLLISHHTISIPRPPITHDPSLSIPVNFSHFALIPLRASLLSMTPPSTSPSVGIICATCVIMIMISAKLEFFIRASISPSVILSNSLLSCSIPSHFFAFAKISSESATARASRISFSF